MLITKNNISLNKKHRLDIFLVTSNKDVTRSRVQQLIKGGHVKVDGKICNKTGTLVDKETVIKIDRNAIPYVSRAGLKLDYALEVFDISVCDKVCLDIGASTGGFTDCLIKRGAKFVFSVDVGHGQLHSSLRNNSRVSSVEGIDIRDFSLPKDMAVDLICIDVSYISLTLVLPVVRRFLATHGNLIILIKPQFEVGPGIVNKQGVVKNKNFIYNALYKVLTFAQELKLFPVALAKSPIKGKKGNIEYLACLKLETTQRAFSVNDLISELERR